MSLSSVLAPDPFGIRRAEMAVWRALHESGAFDEMLCRQDEERGAIERQALRLRLAGIYRNEPRSMLSATTLHYFLDRLVCPLDDVRAELANWFMCFRSRQQFMTGRCHEFALVAHAHLGWPMMVALGHPHGLAGLAGGVVHIMLLAPDGCLFDVQGYKSVEDARPAFYSEPWCPISVEEVMVHTSNGLRPIASLDEARHAVAAVLDILVDSLTDSLGILDSLNDHVSCQSGMGM